DLIGQAARLISGVYKTWWDCDASLVEINPLCVVAGADGKLSLMAVDAKVSVDDNALYRHPDIQAMRDLAEEAPLEIEASKFSLNYIKLDGNIACLVNGAGLAMATMDIIQHYGGMPANFLDVGGGASAEQVAAAFKILMADRAVKAVLINIFGGILRVDVLAQGVVEAVRQVKVSVPIVCRLEGTNVEAGKEILSASELNFTLADDMLEAARKVVALAGAR
ncbi:MAG TPA: succinate--CoA ligase subunit beta, partial [Candidatus Polarisedimenticolia bacterium]|nr:succinate--CoA ligase subunit beta [Candidatus Polarisedimenticolia bacterium]